MKKSTFLVIPLVFCQLGFSKLVLPPEISAGISQSSVGESGGMFFQGVKKDVFLDYIRGHWREIIDNIEDLPRRAGAKSNPDSVMFNASVNTFGAACEWLPPMEYLDFMDKFLELYEQKRIGYLPFEMQMTADCKKQDFLAVNWEHPRVKAIFAKARKLTPPKESSFLSWMDDAEKGALADNYMNTREDGDPLPETLPGIKLQRPWASLMKKYYALTGKKVPPDPKWDPRPPRRGEAQGNLAAVETGSHRDSRAVWPWLAAAATLIATLFFIWKSRRKARSAP